MDARPAEPVEKSLWGSPAGKRHLADRIVRAMPSHRVYVEAFAGGAQVLFAKERSEVEVLNDLDADIAFAFRFARDLSKAQLEQLRRKSWVGDRDRFDRLYHSEPKDPVDRFYRFAYLARFSFNKQRRGTLPSKLQGVEARFVEQLEREAPRLDGVLVRQADYEKVVDEFDGKETFFFLDPPYAGYDAGVGNRDFDEERFARVLGGIRGRFLVTYGIRSDPALFRGLHRYRWTHMSGVGTAQGHGQRRAVTLIVTNYRLPERAMKGLDAMEEPASPATGGARSAEHRVAQLDLWESDGVEDAEVAKTIWGSPAGKKRLAARLVKLIPPHKVYVEPFAGSGAVFFEKEPVETEVLADADPEIAAAYRALKSLTGDELAALRKKDWVGRESTFKGLLDAAPPGKVGKLYRFLYLSHFSYGKLRGKSFNPNAAGVEARTLDRIDQFADRLKNATIRHAHYADVVKEFDGTETFFYLDPPYPGHNVEVGEDEFDEDEFRKILDGIKGRFLVTYGTRGELETKGFQVRLIRPPRTIRAMHGVGGPKTLPTLLIANYAIAEKALDDGWEVDEVETAVELTGEAAADLDHARALAKALAAETPEPSIVHLAGELDRIDGGADERVTTLAAELMPIGERLSAALEASVPDAAEALREAAPLLAELAKAQWTRAEINDLPDDAFLYVEPGGKKDEDGKTVPRALRHFPVYDADGKLDIPHLRNALARIPQSAVPGLTADAKEKLQDRARRLLEEAQNDAVEKARQIPFQQWGGSAKYARKLAERLPEHDRYVEPFCGAAAVFFAKEAADQEVLADANPEVIFALRYLQRLDDDSFAALKRFPWTVSRAGFEKVRAAAPRSDAARFWKLVYGRLCTWGAKPNLSGYATIHDGQSYDLADLWKFHDRLQGVRLVTQDWKNTLADHDGAGTLFFLDPPYAGEWAVGDGIPPEEIAEAVAKLKGRYIVAYTDSAEARRALAKVGRPFKMRIPEGRSAGQWQKRSRLFVASPGIRKVEDIDVGEASPVEKALAQRIPLLKTGEERFVLGIVLEPETVDAQNDVYSAAEVREAAHRFLEDYGNIGLMHRGLVNDQVKILESYVAPAEFEVGATKIKKGTWLLAVHVLDDELWAKVKSGDLGGWSIGGSASRSG